MLRWLFAILLISATCFAQDYSTRTEMMAKCRYQNRMVADTITLPDSVLRVFVNDGVSATDNKLRANFGFDTIWTVAGTATYSLNTDCYPNAVISLRILADSSNNVYVTGKRVGQDDQGQYPTTPEGVPVWYSTHGRYISFLPAPPQTYRVEIEYEARSRVYTADADSLTTVKPEHETLVADYVAYLVLKRFNMDYTVIRGQWENDIAIERALMLKKPITTITEQGKQ